MYSHHSQEKFPQPLQAFKRNYFKNQNQFLQFFFHFWNLHEIFHISKKKDQLDDLNVLDIIDSEKCASLHAKKLLF